MLKWFTPNSMKVASLKADLVPIKQMHFHIVNSSALMNTTVSLLFPFLGQNIKDHIHFHYTDWPSLHEKVGKEVLPKEYGGATDTEIEYQKLYANLEKCDELFNNYLLNSDFSKKLEINKPEKKSKTKKV
jgi:hypothetical protein